MRLGEPHKLQKLGHTDDDWQSATVSADSAIDKLFDIKPVEQVKVTYRSGTSEQWRRTRTAEDVVSQILDNSYGRPDAKTITKALRDADLLKESQ